MLEKYGEKKTIYPMNLANFMTILILKNQILCIFKMTLPAGICGHDWKGQSLSLAQQKIKERCGSYLLTQGLIKSPVDSEAKEFVKECQR
jgi:hypothetical protein